VSDARVRQLERELEAEPTVARLRALDAARARVGDGLPVRVYVDPVFTLPSPIEPGMIFRLEFPWVDPAGEARVRETLISSGILEPLDSLPPDFFDTLDPR
jgi:hypothetical protein